MILYFVDEDQCQLSPLLLELSFREYKAQHVLNADAAVQKLVDVQQEDFLFVDVMLAAASDESKSVFKREETDDFKTTGLRLVEIVRKDRPDFPTRHIVLMSQAASQVMVEKIRVFAKKHGLRFLQKNAFDDAWTFADEVEKIVREA
jgi:CheY-like chemotaxis protein